MATKKAQPKKTETMSMGSEATWKWIYVIGGLVAGLVGALAAIIPALDNQYLTWLLMILGVLAGIFYFNVENFMEFGVAFLVLVAAATALNGFVAVGPYITGFFTGFFAFLGPVALTLLVRLFIKRNF
jgi:hypothetical protein